jgi:hypothetical protein
MKLIVFLTMILLSALNILNGMESDNGLSHQGRSLKIHAGKRETKNKKIFDQFNCSRCDTPPLLRSNIMKHMHNKCFPVEGLPCTACPQSTEIKFKSLRQIVTHNTNNHADLKKWKCLVCGSRIKKFAFFKHFLANTFPTNLSSRIGGFTEVECREIIEKSHVAPLQPLLPPPSAEVIESNDIPWVFYKPTINQGIKEWVRTNENGEQII